MSRLLPLGTLVVVITDAVLLWLDVIDVRTAILLFLSVEFPLGIMAVIGVVRRYRGFRATTDPRGALRALAADDPVLRFAVAEGRLLASFARWVTGRHDVPRESTAIGYSRGTSGIPLALAAACAIEIVAIHLIVPWPGVRMALDLLGVYGLVCVLSLCAARVVRPHLAHGDRLELRQGSHRCGAVPAEAIATVRRDRQVSLTETGIRTVDRGRADGVTGDVPELVLSGPDGTGVTIELHRPVPLSVPDWPWRRPTPRPVSRIRLHVDDPDGAVRLLNGGRWSAPSTPPRNRART